MGHHEQNKKDKETKQCATLLPSRFVNDTPGLIKIKKQGTKIKDFLKVGDKMSQLKNRTKITNLEKQRNKSYILAKGKQ